MSVIDDVFEARLKFEQGGEEALMLTIDGQSYIELKADPKATQYFRIMDAEGNTRFSGLIVIVDYKSKERIIKVT